VLRGDSEVTAVLDEARIDACFDLKRALTNVSRVFDALDEDPDASGTSEVS